MTLSEYQDIKIFLQKVIYSKLVWRNFGVTKVKNDVPWINNLNGEVTAGTF